VSARGAKVGDIHRFAYVAKQRAWLAYIDSFIKTFPSGIDEPLRIGINFSDRICCIEISVKACKCILVNAMGQELQTRE